MTTEFIYPLRIHIEDTDFTGLVYHSNYLNFMERARSEWLESVGMGMEWQREQQVYFPLIDISIQFLKPVTVHQQVEIVSSIKKMTAATATFSQYLRPQNDKHKILCKAEIKIACVNEKLRPRPFPEMPISFNLSSPE